MQLVVLEMKVTDLSSLLCIYFMPFVLKQLEENCMYKVLYMFLLGCKGKGKVVPLLN
jgi:hypothetical protein